MASPTSENRIDTMLGKFFHEQLKDIYWAEKHLTKALPKMRKAATNADLQAAFEDHLAATEQQVERLEKVFELLGLRAQGKTCEAMEGLVKEGEEVIESTKDDTATRDVGLIIAAQKVEHYEIASYGSLAQLARGMGWTDVAGLLEETLQEEKDTDALLTSIAEGHINEQAEMEPKSGRR